MYTGQNEHEPHGKRAKRSSNGQRTCLNGHVTDETGINTQARKIVLRTSRCHQKASRKEHLQRERDDGERMP